jgi:hypothetical protein
MTNGRFVTTPKKGRTNRHSSLALVLTRVSVLLLLAFVVLPTFAQSAVDVSAGRQTVRIHDRKSISERAHPLLGKRMPLPKHVHIFRRESA